MQRCRLARTSYVPTSEKPAFFFFFLQRCKNQVLLQRSNTSDYVLSFPRRQFSLLNVSDSNFVGYDIVQIALQPSTFSILQLKVLQVSAKCYPRFCSPEDHSLKCIFAVGYLSSRL